MTRRTRRGRQGTEPNATATERPARSTVRGVVLVAVAVAVVAGGLSTPALAAPPASVDTGVVQQVGVSVTNVSAGFVAGGNVSGPGTALVGQAGAAGRVTGDAVLFLERLNVDASVTLAGAVGSGVADVTDTASARVQFEGTVGALDRERTLAWNWSYPAGEPTVLLPRDGALGVDGPERSTVSLVATLLRSPGSGSGFAVLAPAQARSGDFLRVSLWGLYGFIVNLLLGLVLLAALPSFSRRVTDEMVDDPVRTGALGIAALVAVPLLLLLLALSLFGLPLALAGAVAFVVLSWVGAVYVRIAIGTWLLAAVPRALSRVGGDYPPVKNRWAGLLVGAVVVAVLLAVPVLGGLVDILVIALGLGAVGRLVSRAYRRTERSRGTGSPEPTVGADE